MIRIGIICPSEIALRRFLPSLNGIEEIKYCGVAIANAKEWFGNERTSINEEFVKKTLVNERRKANEFVDKYGGIIWNSYQDMINSDDINAIYLPLPPALHFKWAKKALEAGKHVLVEKPSTTTVEEIEELCSLAKKKNLALHENYMFAYHEQLTDINEIVHSGEIGDVRLYRISFGFPRRAQNDFRYNKLLGGGALLDCGGYTIKYASMLLGDSARVVYSQLNYIDEFDVDVYGSAALANNEGVTVQIAFGMDNAYKCELEVWGSKGTLITGRVLTAPAGFEPECKITVGNDEQVRQLHPDDTFKKSLQKFISCIKDANIRLSTYNELIKQERLLEEFRRNISK